MNRRDRLLMQLIAGVLMTSIPFLIALRIAFHMLVNLVSTRMGHPIQSPDSYFSMIDFFFIVTSLACFPLGLISVVRSAIKLGELRQLKAGQD